MRRTGFEGPFGVEGRVGACLMLHLLHQILGMERLQAAKDKLFDQCYAMPAYAWDFGLDYCRNFLREGLP